MILKKEMSVIPFMNEQGCTYLPTGVMSKNDIGARSTLDKSDLCSRFEDEYEKATSNKKPSRLKKNSPAHEHA